jgi:hypothetical protein
LIGTGFQQEFKRTGDKKQEIRRPEGTNRRLGDEESLFPKRAFRKIFSRRLS